MHPPAKRTERRPKERPRRALQFRLSTLFVVTTVFAIASAGFARGSVMGALGAMFGAGIALMGLTCVGLSVLERPGLSILALATGIAYFLLGAVIWAWCVF